MILMGILKNFRVNKMKIMLILNENLIENLTEFMD